MKANKNNIKKKRESNDTGNRSRKGYEVKSRNN